MRRDASLTDNASLSPALILRAGDRLYDGLTMADGYDFGEENGVHYQGCCDTWSHEACIDLNHINLLLTSN